MRKRIIFLSLLTSITLFVNAQTDKHGLPLKNTISDRSAITPPDMERNYDQLLSKWGNTVKYADDCQCYANDAITFPDSVYTNRLYTLPTRMELAFNPLVKTYIEMYAGRRRNQVSYMLGEGKYYFPLFEEALDREGLPLELKYLPVIESALNPIARSRVGATGLWQFMAATGRMYDLEINSLVDERRDPLKSTNAAARYLKDLYNIYGDWNLVIAAYNCGPGNVNKAIRRSGGQTDYWTIYPFLPKETRGYVPIFIAATYIMNYYKDHDICPADCKLPASMDTLSIDQSIHFQQITDVLGIPIDDLRKFNPQFTNDIIPGNFKPYALNLPIQKITAFIENKDSIVSHRSQELLTHRKVAGVAAVSGGKVSTGALTHRVKRGETLGGIAKRYGITLTQLKQWNGLKTNRAAVGRYLTIGFPPKKEANKEEIAQVTDKNETTVSKTTPAGKKTQAQTQVTYYKIKKGDTWGGIAKKNNVTISNLKKWNGIKSNTLIAGKSLKIQKTVYVPIAEPELAVAETTDSLKIAEPQISVVGLDSTYTAVLIDDYLQKMERDEDSLPTISIAGADDADEELRKQTDDRRIIYHKVKIGETITQIASHYNVTKKEIQRWNKLTSNTAKVGQRLLIKLPEKESATTGSNTSTNIGSGNLASETHSN